MESNALTITESGRKELVEELAFLEGERTAEIKQRLKEARDFGDLSENSEYDDAKAEQAQNEARIAEVRKILATATVVADSTSKGASKTVGVGTQVEVEDAKGNRQTYSIVGTVQARSLERMISEESPLGAALIGHKKGDEVEFVTPAGKKRSVKIVKITPAKSA